MSKPVLLLPRHPVKARSITRRSLPVRRSLWDRIYDDLGRPPTNSWRRDLATIVLVAFVLFAMTFVGYQP
jgi:hypothetical protein